MPSVSAALGIHLSSRFVSSALRACNAAQVTMSPLSCLMSCCDSLGRSVKHGETLKLSKQLQPIFVQSSKAILDDLLAAVAEAGNASYALFPAQATAGSKSPRNASPNRCRGPRDGGSGPGASVLAGIEPSGLLLPAEIPLRLRAAITSVRNFTKPELKKVGIACRSSHAALPLGAGASFLQHMPLNWLGLTR